jgi:hypothetical protein
MVFHIIVHRLTQGVLRMLRLCSGSAPAAHPWLRLDHPQLRLKQQLLMSADQNGTSEREN